MRADPRLTDTFALAKPSATHRRKATCAEANCKNMINGFQIHVNPSSAQAARQEYLIKSSGRRYSVSPEPGGLLYTFEAGQQCFGEHTVPIDRPALYLVRKGSNPVKHHAAPSDWVDDFSTHLDKIREQ